MELCLEEKSRKSKELLEWYNLLKQREDCNSSVELDSDILKVTVDGVQYSITDILKKYGVLAAVFKHRIEKGYSIYESLTLKRNSYVDRKRFSFLGKTYKNYQSFCDYYNIPKSMSSQLVKENSTEDLEKIFLRLFELIKKSKIENFREIGYLLSIYKRLKCEDDIIYQIQNYDKLEDNCYFYLGGKSYRGLLDFFKDYNIGRKSYLGKLIFSENPPLYKIAGMLDGSYTPKISSESPSTYLYIYFKNYIIDRDISSSVALTNLRIDNIRKMLANGSSAEEVKDLLDTYTFLIKSLYFDSKDPDARCRSFIFKYMNGILSREGLEKFFNIERTVHTSSRDRLLQYSNVKILRKVYRVQGVLYYQCRVGNRLEYLSGTELVDIAIESVKELRLSNKKE